MLSALTLALVGCRDTSAQGWVAGLVPDAGFCWVRLMQAAFNPLLTKSSNY